MNKSKKVIYGEDSLEFVGEVIRDSNATMSEMIKKGVESK